MKIIKDRGAPTKLTKAELCQQIADLEASLAEYKQREIEREALLAAEQTRRRIAETLHRASLVLNSSLNYEAVLDHILEQVRNLIPHDAASIMLIEGNIARTFRWRGYDQFITKDTAMLLDFDITDTPTFRTMQETGRPLVVPSVAEDKTWVPRDEQNWIKSYIGVPIAIRKQVIGFINLNSTHTGSFGPADIEPLQAFSHLIAIALSNAKIYDQGRQEIIQRVRMLKKERNFISAVLDTAGALVMVLNRQGRIIRFNRACEQTTGYSFEEVKGKCWWDLFLPPEEAGPLKADFEQLWLHPSSGRRESYWITRTGQRLIAWLNTLLFNHEGEVEYILLTGLDLTERKQMEEALRRAHDELEQRVEERTVELLDTNMMLIQEITERKRAEEALRMSEMKFRSIVQSASDAIILMNSYGSIISWNNGAQLIFGYTEDEVMNRPLTLLMPEQYREVYQNELLHVNTTGQIHLLGKMVELIGLRKDGQEFPLELSMASWQTEEGAFYSSIIRDTTTRKHLEKQLHQSQKMEALGQLTGGIAHDFNNLLTAIIGFAELMRFQVSPEDPIRELADKVVGSSERAANLVRQLLTFSRRQVIEPQVLDVNTIVAQMDDLLRRIIGEDIELKTLLQPSLWPVKVDPAQIEQVIVNLVVNARDAMPDGGQITIESTNIVLNEHYSSGHLGAQPGEYVLLAVSDTGIGMTEEVKTHLFEPFFTTKAEGKGTGLGLATVYGIVKQSGGDIWVYSEVGQGSTFKIYLPRAEADTQPLACSESEVAMPRGSETILLVEDDPEVRNLIRRVLHGQGYTLLEAADPQEALLLFSRYSGPIHLVLTDIVMPGMNGKTLVSQMSQTQPNLKILFMSGYTDNVIAHHGVLDPSAAFLQKPFSPITLLYKVREVLDQK